MRQMRFGLGWRAELGAGILAHLDRIEVLEVMAEDVFDAGRDQRRAWRFLGTQVPIVLHATSLGLASPERVDVRLLRRIAKVAEWLEPRLWSEHLAFVRSGSVEVGHLAAPPRNDATLAGLQRNVEEARRIVGSLPLLENVASLIDPPLSTYDERAWLHAVLAATGCNLLLDLHNLWANAVNFGFDAATVAMSLPASRIGMIHLAGGRRIEGNRVLDDHLHDVPDPVYDLLALVQAPYVALERDGNYPTVEALVGQLERARKASADGTGTDGTSQTYGTDGKSGSPIGTMRPMGPISPISFLTQLYTNPATRTQFLAAPYDVALAHGLSLEDARAVATINPDDLALAARGFAKKRELKARCRESASRSLFRGASRE